MLFSAVIQRTFAVPLIPFPDSACKLRFISRRKEVCNFVLGLLVACVLKTGPVYSLSVLVNR